MTHKMNATGQLIPDVRYTDDPEELRLLEKPIGKWGSMWQDWIKATYPAEVTVYIMAAITTNLAFSEWTQLFENEMMLNALIDRVTFRSHILNMNCESSFRMESSLKNL